MRAAYPALALAALLAACSGEADGDGPVARPGEARRGAVTVDLPAAVAAVPISAARVPGRPLVLIDPGHGGSDPGAIGVSGAVQEKALTLAMARELRDRLARSGQVRAALTRQGDQYPSLDQRAALARALGAGMFVSIHMDSAPNPDAVGTTVYSLADVASSAEAAAVAAVANRRAGDVPAAGSTPSVADLLSLVERRDLMDASAGIARRIVRRARGSVTLRPRPHQFADFHVLRRAGVPAVLVEAGYISNRGDEARLASVEGRRPLVEALARAIEADLLIDPR